MKNLISIIEQIVNRIVIKTDTDNSMLLEIAKEFINSKFNLKFDVRFVPLDDTQYVDSIVIYYITKEDSIEKIPKNSIVFTTNKKIAEKFGAFFFTMT
ncbi:MAG: hypothetical protein RMJ67_01300 [Elusimicrobiota bacterium]|nr:hypothetical protein [Endomicrobiia bacterium]MDW8165140.1 hypothetical protein [Elusimicrobiota bacterium]